MPSNRLRRVLLAAALTVTGLVVAAPAHAGVLLASAPSCDAQDLSRPFMPFVDFAQYTPAPDGGLEQGGAGWTLTGGAQVVAGNESYSVGGPADASSLSLPAGSSGATAPMCVGIEHPDMRFFVRRSGGTMLSSLRVEVLYEGNDGDEHSLTVGVVGGSGSWAPSPVVPIVVNLLALLPGDHTPVAFRFTPNDSASWSVDDVYVDPPKRCC